MAMRTFSLSVLTLSVVAVLPTSAFQRPHLCLRCKHLHAPRKIAFIRRFMGPRYGPNKDNVADDGGTASVVDIEQENWERHEAARVSKQEVEFRKLIQDVISTANPEHLPSIMTKHMDLLLTMRGYEGATLIEGVLKEANEKGEDQQVMDAIEYILSFAEVFVDQAHTLDDYNKRLLGKIIKTITNKGSARDKEELLDELMESEKGNFTPGFLKHVEGECERIAHAPVMTPESSRLLQILLMIQARVLEELGSDIGEEALVLGQLLGYDDARERLAVLEAGLTVRGLDFAKQMAALTEEALEGFTRVHCGADPDLVERVSEIDSRLRKFIQQQKILQ